MIFDQELKIAREAASAAGEIQLVHHKSIRSIEVKNDDSPVTEVDTICESVVYDLVHRHFPSDGFLGEETGLHKGASGRTWIVDPLDGTRPYIRGIPTHSSLIALEDGDEIVVGCMVLPALGETYWACKGGGAFLNGDPVHVSSVADMSGVLGCAIGFIEKNGTRDVARLMQLMAAWDYAYGFMDAYSYGCIAAGRIDLSVNLLDKPWDCAAAACIVREAGGRFSDIRGTPSVHNGSCVLSNGLLHDAVLEYFKPSLIDDRRTV